MVYSSVIRQKGEFQNGCFKKNKARQIFWKKNIFYPLIRTRLSHTHTFPPSDRCVCASGGKKCLFFGKFDVLCFLWFWDLPFCIITNVLIKWNSKIIYSYDMMLRPRIFRVCRKSLRARYACYVFMYFFFGVDKIIFWNNGGIAKLVQNIQFLVFCPFGNIFERLDLIGT